MNVVAPNIYASMINQFLQINKKEFEMGDEQVSVIGFPFDGKTRFVVVMKNDDDLLVQIFADAKQKYAFQEAMESMVEDGKVDSVFRFNFVQVEMRAPDELFDEEYDAYVKADVDMVEDIPIFRNFKAGYSIWVIDEVDAALTSAALDIVSELVTHGELPVQAYYSRVDGKLVESPFYVMEQEPLREIEISSTTSKLSFRRKGKWLLGSYYLPFPNMLDDSMRPMHSLVCLVMDEDTEEIIRIFETEENKDPFLSFNEQLYAFMKENKKRPRSVAFYGEEDFNAFFSLFHHLDVEIEESNQYDILNDVWASLEDEFLMNLEMAMEEENDNKTIH